MTVGFTPPPPPPTARSRPAGSGAGSIHLSRGPSSGATLQLTRRDRSSCVPSACCLRAVCLHAVCALFVCLRAVCLHCVCPACCLRAFRLRAVCPHRACPACCLRAFCLRAVCLHRVCTGCCLRALRLRAVCLRAAWFSVPACVPVRLSACLSVCVAPRDGAARRARARVRPGGQQRPALRRAAQGLWCGGGATVARQSCVTVDENLG